MKLSFSFRRFGLPAKQLLGAWLFCAAAAGPALAQTPPASESAAPSLPQLLPLSPQRTIDFVTDEGTWMALDVSPDGETIIFDLLGDIYALDADGGRARPLLQGMAFETHPVYSPDGTQFAFISDRSGSANLWIADSDGANLKQLSFDEGRTLFASPAWSADGRSVLASRAVYSVLAFELYRYDKDGGGAERVTEAEPSGGASAEARHNALGAVASPDGALSLLRDQDRFRPDGWGATALVDCTSRSANRYARRDRLRRRRRHAAGPLSRRALSRLCEPLWRADGFAPARFAWRRRRLAGFSHRHGRPAGRVLFGAGSAVRVHA